MPEDGGQERDGVAIVDGYQLIVDQEALTIQQLNNSSTEPAKPEPPTT